MDLKELKALLRLMEGNDVEELEIEEGGRRIRVRRRSGQPPPHPAGGIPVSLAAIQTAMTGSAPPPAVAASDTARLTPVESPMVGTFYRAPAPGAEPYVKEGDLIQKGTVVCIIEAMKLMNEIESDLAGAIVKRLVANAQPVEYGQVLFLIRAA